MIIKVCLLGRGEAHLKQNSRRRKSIGEVLLMITREVERITYTVMAETAHSATLGRLVPTTLLAEPNTFKKLICWYMNLLTYETLEKWTGYIPFGGRPVFAPRLNDAFFACSAYVLKGQIFFRNDEHPQDERLNAILIVKEWLSDSLR